MQLSNDPGSSQVMADFDVKVMMLAHMQSAVSQDSGFVGDECSAAQHSAAGVQEYPCVVCVQLL